MIPSPRRICTVARDVEDGAFDGHVRGMLG